jgi:hypothetical protein
MKSPKNLGIVGFAECSLFLPMGKSTRNNYWAHVLCLMVPLRKSKFIAAVKRIQQLAPDDSRLLELRADISA